MELKQIEASLWGQKYKVTPYLVERTWGDGKQFVKLSPMLIRPNFYVIRVDSKTELEGDKWLDHLEEIMDAIDEEFGPCCEIYGSCECDHWETWPATFDWGGSTWSELGNDTLAELGLIRKQKKRRYTYSNPRPGVWLLEPTPKTGPDAMRFRSQTRRIVIELFGEGASLNKRNTARGDVQFQGVQASRMAHQVALLWNRRHGRQQTALRKGKGR
jgi:hypothetical protein